MPDREESADTMHTLRRESITLLTGCSAARRRRSHQPHHEGFENVEQDVRDDRADVESAETGNNAAKGSENRLAQQVAPPHPWGIGRYRQPRADDPDYDRRFQDREGPAHQQMENAG